VCQHAIRSPRYDSGARTFALDIAAGNDRKKSGSTLSTVCRTGGQRGRNGLSV
jgi:hypothetical protein